MTRISDWWSGRLTTVVLIHVLAGMAMYLLLLVEPWMIQHSFKGNLSVSGAVVSIFGAGIYLLGPFANYWLDRYSRKNVALESLLIMLLATVLTLYHLPEWVYVVARFVQGAAYGLFQIAVGSTLLIDLTPAGRRTVSARVYYWGTRLALACGPLLALCLRRYDDNLAILIWLSVGLVVAAGIMLLALTVPFRSPYEPERISLDRFWLPRARFLYFTMLPLTFSLGLLVAGNFTLSFYLLLLVGFSVSWIGLRFCRKHERRFVMLVGFLALMGSFVLHLFFDQTIAYPASGLLAGVGVGLLTDRYLLCFIRVSEHCERGTAQSTYMLGWETGLCMGVLCAGFMQSVTREMLYVLGFVLILISAVCYFAWVHRWFLKHCRKQTY